MKRRTALVVITLFTLLGTLFAPPSSTVLAADATVRIIPAATDVDVGQTAVLQVYVDDISNLSGAEFHISFDASRLEVIDADAGKDGVQVNIGDFLVADFVAKNEADNTAGKIDFGIAQMSPNTPVSGSGTLASITFRGKAEGTANVTLDSVLMSDANGAQIPVSTESGSITVQTDDDETPTPTETSTATTTPSPTTTETATATATTTPPPTSCESQGYHTVRPGETLYAIGRAYAVKPSAIASCNGIVNPSRLHVGIKLGIPYALWSPVPTGPKAARQFDPGGTTPTPTPAPGCRYYHRVVYGENLTLIGMRYGVSIWSIARANNIHNLNLIFAGDTLCIP
jgi:LysM repeat protein